MQSDNPIKAWRSHLTSHAAERLEERTSFAAEAFLSLLDEGQCIPVGIETMTNRLHRLIFSPEDDDYFVAVQDMSNGEVITVLTLEYHQNLAWALSSRSLAKARRLVDGFQHPTALGGITTLKLSAVLSDSPLDSLKMVRMRSLRSFPLSALDRPLEILETSSTFCAHVKEQLSAKNISASKVRRIVGKLGKGVLPSAIFEYDVDFLAEGPSVDPSA